MTELDLFTHAVFTNGGGPQSHAIPAHPHEHIHTCKHPQAHIAAEHAVTVLSETAVMLLHETLRDCLIALGTVGVVLGRIGPAASLPVVVVIVVVVQYSARKITGK